MQRFFTLRSCLQSLAVVSFPGQVIGSFFGGLPTDANNKHAHTGARTQPDHADHYLQAQADLLTAQAALDKAKAGTTTP